MMRICAGQRKRLALEHHELRQDILTICFLSKYVVTNDSVCSGFALIVQEAAQFAAAAGVFQLAQGLCLDLADTFPGDAELLTDFFQCVVGIHPDTKPHAQHALFTGRQRGQNPCCGFPQVRMDCGIRRQQCVLVFDEIAQMAVFFVSDWGFQRDRLFRNLQNLADFFQRPIPPESVRARSRATSGGMCVPAC